MPRAPHWGRGLPNHSLLQIHWGKGLPWVTCGESVLLGLVQHFFLASDFGEVGDAEERPGLAVSMLSSLLSARATWKSCGAWPHTPAGDNL